MDYQEYISHEKVLARRAYAALCDYGCYFAICIIYFLIFLKKVGNGVWMGSLFPDGFVIVCIWLIWFPVTEAWKGSTIFKSVFKLKVVHKDGKKVSLEGSLIRHFFDPIDLFIFFGLIGVILAKVTKKHQRIGDIVASTCVVMSNTPIFPTVLPDRSLIVI